MGCRGRYKHKSQSFWIWGRKGRGKSEGTFGEARGNGFRGKAEAKAQGMIGKTMAGGETQPSAAERGAVGHQRWGELWGHLGALSNEIKSFPYTPSRA